jgi:hypothetical protein
LQVENIYKMKGEKIQTLHPNVDKTGKRIAIEKYNALKQQMLLVLKGTELTHTELMEQLYHNLKDSFEGNVQWYGETVKLDLEARQLIERTKTKPEKYFLRKKK